MFLANPAVESIGKADALVAAILGYAVVFVGLILLMIVVILLGKAMVKAAKTKKEAPATVAPAAADAATAPGSAGEVKLYDVPDRTAAMLMAIVAEKMGRPLNELRFKSIKEVKEV